MQKKPAAAIASLLLLAIAVSAIGQSLFNNPAQSVSAQTIPTRGMTMEFVESKFGSPSNRRAPVGDPPITRWEYQQFIVYFENKRVIHSVSKRPQN